MTNICIINDKYVCISVLTVFFSFRPMQSNTTNFLSYHKPFGRQSPINSLINNLVQIGNIHNLQTATTIRR